jgi:hypothetical protein
MTDQSVTEADQQKPERGFPWQRLAIVLVVVIAVAVLLPILLVALPGHGGYVEIKP